MELSALMLCIAFRFYIACPLLTDVYRYTVPIGQNPTGAVSWDLLWSIFSPYHILTYEIRQWDQHASATFIKFASTSVRLAHIATFALSR